MLLHDRLQRLGDAFFRYRSLTPLVAILELAWVRDTVSHPLEVQWLSHLYVLGCLAVVLAGLGVRAAVVGRVPRGTSGRVTEGQKARVLNTTGFYSIVRNPLYVGNFLCWIGISALLQSGAILLVNTALFFIQYVPIVLREEAFLLEKFGDDYRAWAARTPWILPKPALWRAPERPFDWAMLLRREPDTIYGVLATFYGLVMLRGWILDGELALAGVWTWAFLALTALWAVNKVRVKRERAARKRVRSAEAG